MNLSYDEASDIVLAILDEVRKDRNTEYLELLGYHNGLMSALYHQLVGVELIQNEEARYQFTKIVSDKIVNSYCEEGVYVAIIAVDAAMKQFIHSTLQSPHSVGKFIQIGGALDRLIKILSATKSESNSDVQASIMISLYDSMILKDIVVNYKHKLVGRSLDNMILDYTILNKSEINSTEYDFSWYEQSKYLTGSKFNLKTTKYLMRITLDLFGLYVSKVDIFGMLNVLNSGNYIHIISPIINIKNNQWLETDPMMTSSLDLSSTEDIQGRDLYILYLDIMVGEMGQDKVLDEVSKLSIKDIQKSLKKFKRVLESRINTIVATKNPNQNKIDLLNAELKRLEATIENINPTDTPALEFVYPHLLLERLKELKNITISGIEGISDIIPRISSINKCLFASYFISTSYPEYEMNLNISNINPRSSRINPDISLTQPIQSEYINPRTSWMVMLDRGQMNIGCYNLNDVKHLLSYPKLGFDVKDGNIVDSLIISMSNDITNLSWIYSNFVQLENSKMSKEIYSEVKKRFPESIQEKISSYSDKTEYIDIITAVESQIYLNNSIPVSTVDIYPSSVGTCSDNIKQYVQLINQYLDLAENIAEESYRTFVNRETASSSISFRLSEYIVNQDRNLERARIQRKSVKLMLGEDYSYLFSQVDKEITSVSEVLEDLLQEYIENEYKKSVESLLVVDPQIPAMVRLKITSRILNNISEYLKINVIQEGVKMMPSREPDEGFQEDIQNKQILTTARSRNSSVSDEWYLGIPVVNMFGLKYRILSIEVLDKYNIEDELRRSSDPINLISTLLKNDEEFQSLNSKSRIVCDGFNLEDIFSDYTIDPSTTYTTDLQTTFQIMGIECVRNLIIREFVELAESNNIRVDIRHVILLVDMMTSTGALQSLELHGMKNSINDIIYQDAKSKLMQTVKGTVSGKTKISKFSSEFFGYDPESRFKNVQDKISEIREMSMGINIRDLYKKNIEESIGYDPEYLNLTEEEPIQGQTTENTTEETIKNIANIWNSMGFG